MGDHREEGEQTGKCHNKRSLTLDVQWQRHQMMGVMSGPLSTTQCQMYGKNCADGLEVIARGSGCCLLLAVDCYSLFENR